MAGLFKWSARKAEPPATAPAPTVVSVPGPDLFTVSKVFPRFVAALAQRPSPVLLDLGPVVGSNISYFGARVPCKIYVEDLFSEIEKHSKRNEPAKVGAALMAHLTQADESVDGILCWDVFDYLDKGAGQLLAHRLAKLLRKGGALYGFFGTTQAELHHYSRFIVEGEDRLCVRTVPASPVRRNVLQNRDIIKMFHPLLVAESVLLKSSTRETLFRKP